MARPPSTTATAKQHLTKSEKRARQTVEESNGGILPAVPPESMPPNQQEVYTWLLATLSDAGFLGLLDEVAVYEACDVIAGLKEINEEIQASGCRTDRELLTAKQAYHKMFCNICGQLGLSPQARAKLGTLTVAAMKDKADPLLEALGA